MQEIWKTVRDFNNYEVSNLGQIKRNYKTCSRIIKPSTKKDGKVVVRFIKNGKRIEKTVAVIVAKEFLGPKPLGYAVYHKNGIKADNQVWNLQYISKQELGVITGLQSQRKPVVKLDAENNIIDYYKSAREAGRQNFMSYQTVIDRCNGKVKSKFAPDGYIYKWDDEYCY